MTDESDDLRRAREDFEQAQRDAAHARGRWPDVHTLSREMREAADRNHFGDLFTRAFRERRRQA